jgi:hypothetical protein
MLLALALLVFPAPQAYSAASDSGNSKPVISAAVRPLLLSKDVPRSSAVAEADVVAPDVPLSKSFPTDVPSVTRISRPEPASPTNYFPEAPVPHIAAANSSGMNAIEAPIKPAARAAHSETLTTRRVWYGLLVAGHSAAALDAYSTRRVVSQNLGTERNPLLRPFANSNSLYLAVQASPLLMDFLGRRMMTSEHKWVRRMWWLPQSAGTVASVLSSVHNLRISQ